MYRPDDWPERIQDYYGSRRAKHRSIFEAGADAMLEALKNNGGVDCPSFYLEDFVRTGEQRLLNVLNSTRQKGWLVFIPEVKNETKK